MEQQGSIRKRKLVEDVSGAVTKFRKRFPDIEVISKIPDDVLLSLWMRS